MNPSFAVGAGAYAGCAYCTHVGVYSKTLKKMVYPGNRRFLPQNDRQRTNVRSYPSQAADARPPPQIKTMQYIDEANEKFETTSGVERKDLVQKTGCKGAYSLQRASSHNRVLDTPSDPMHLVKDIVEHVVNLVVGKEDSFKVRQQEEQCKRFPSSWMQDVHNTLPKAPFSLTSDVVSLADERAMSICVPTGFDWRPRAIFGKATGMKSHEWKQVATNGVLKFCLRDMLCRSQRSTLFELLDVITDLCAEEIVSSRIGDLEARVHKALVLIERDFPLSMQVIVFHLLHHLPMFLRRFGPVYGFWMYPYECFNSWIAQRVKSRRYPEATVVETYRLSEWAHFLEISRQLPDGATMSADLFDDRDINQHDSSKPSSERSEEVTLSGEQINQLERFYEDESCSISPCAMMMKHVTYTDHHRRTIRLTTADTEREQSHTRCSYISTMHRGSVAVGRIMSIFDHTHSSHTLTFAYVSWFDTPSTDRDTKLMFVDTTVQSQSVIPITSLSKPLVTAFDEEEPGRLWILNLK